MSVAEATVEQVFDARTAVGKLLPKLQLFAQGYENPELADAEVITEIDELVEDAKTALVALVPDPVEQG